MPGFPPTLAPNVQDQVQSPQEPQRLPPPPPQKIPLDNEDEPKIATMIPKRPQYDLQHNFGGEQQQNEHRSRRPHFDPQHSHDTLNSPIRPRHQEQQPTKPAPHFTNFAVESALPPVRADQEPSQQQQSCSIYSQQEPDVGRYHAGQHLHQSSISPVGPNEEFYWTQIGKPWDSQAAYAPSPEQRHAVLVHQDGHSISTTDLSSNTAGKSTPESQQTSNTSDRESEDQSDQGRHDKEGDDSFYWHSGRSSSGAEEEYSQSSSPAATPGQASVDRRSSTTNSTVVPREHPDLPVRSTSLSPSNPASYGASALGFGGPSDWEYFGDYEVEEIDDEELYSRPRPRDKFSTTEGSAELPADPPSTDSMQRPRRSQLSTSRSMTRKTQPMPEDAPARRQITSNSQDHILRSSKPSVEGDSAPRTKPASEQSPTTPRPLSGDRGAPSKMSLEQCPDLDDIIRVWSEAPHVGKMRDEATHFHVTEYVDEEPPDIAEASVASTPRERMFGVHAILRNAPSLPKLSASIEHVEPLKNQIQQGSSPPAASLKNLLIPQNIVKQKLIDSLSEQPELVLGNLAKDEEIVPVEDGFSSPGQTRNDPVPREAAPLPSDSIVSSDLHYSIPAKPVTDSDPSLRHPVSVEIIGESAKDTVSAPHETPQTQIPQIVHPGPPQEAAQESIHEVARESLEETMLSRRRTTLQPFVQDVIEKVSSSRLSDNTLIGHPVDSATNKPLPLWQESQESAQVVRSGSLQEIKPSGLLESFEISAHEEPIEKSQKLDHAEPSQRRSLEDAKTSQPNVAVDYVPTTAEANEANVAIEHLPEKIRTVVEPQQSDAPVAPIVGPSQSFEILRKTDKANDPFADLDPWGQASLNRFAAMLREEARAESNKDKLNVFNVFTSRESRLRVVLYGTEDELIIPQKQVELQDEYPKKLGIEEKPEDRSLPEERNIVKQAVQRANTMSLQRSLKALPALPSNRDSVIGMPGDALAPLIIQRSSKSVVDRESPTVESPLDEAQYSPGGRPIVARLSRESKQGELDVSQGIVASAEAFAGAYAKHSPSSDTPAALGFEDVDVKKPAYTPLKYSEPRSEVRNYLANRKSVIRPYATLTQGSLENGSNFGKRLVIDTTPSTNTSITAPTSQYNADPPPKGDDASDVTIKPKNLVTDSQHDLRRFMKADFDPLLAILPKSEILVYESARLNDLRHVMEAVPDDFSFIHQSVVAWDATAKKQREENDRERHTRQMESEERIDSLFDDHEIGYGDFSELESEYKRSEAVKKADEDRSEYQMFVSDVFNLVWTRLHYELDQLIPHYEQYSKLMNSTLAGKDMFSGSSDSLSLAPTMSSFLGLHQKLEIRHQKAFEAVLERDRRLKKTEISPWYTLSNITKVKQLEKQFEDAEKKAVIEYCQQRDIRVNQLMDVLDQNTLRGVGANQDYMEAIMKAVRRIASGRAFASVAGLDETTAGMEEVERAKTIVALLATSSEQIVQTFHVADMLLNSADYEVSVATAKVAKVDMTILATLKEEKAKEDQKLMRELEHRLALIREDTRRTNDEIVKLMLFLGLQNGRADSGVPVQTGSGSESGAADPGHEARLQKVLEEAKRRNTSKES